MKNWKTLFLVLAIALGAGIEYFKSAQDDILSSQPQAQLNDPFEIDDYEYNLNLGQNSDNQQQKAQIRKKRQKALSFRQQFRGKLAKVDFGHQNKNAKNSKIANKGKAKKDNKKKAKKKKKDKKKKKSEEETETTESDDSRDNDIEESSVATNEAPAPVFGFGGNNGSTVVSEPTTAEEWFEFLSDEPSFSKTDSFARAFNYKEISFEIYYEVTSLLLEENSKELRRVAIRLLGSAQTVESFSELVLLRREEPASSPVGREIRSYLISYSQNLSLLPILHSTLTAEVESIVKVAAAEQIDKLATRHLAQNSEEVSTNDVSPEETGNVDPVAAQPFQNIVSTLDNLIAGTDSTLAQKASELQERLRGFLDLIVS